MTGLVSGKTRRGVWVAQVTWPEVEARLGAGAIGVLPIGAACKEHGYHLPMNTDFLQAEWFALALAELVEVAVWPTLSYGYYPAFIDYPGSCSLSRETFVLIVGEILEHILRAGASAAVVLNTGISTIKPLQEAIAKVSCPGHIQLVNCYEGPHYRAVAAEIEQQVGGGHADELETSIMLAIAPKQLHMECAEACIEIMVEGPLNRCDPKAPNYSPSGVYGDPRLATKNKGERLVRAILKDLLEIIEGVRKRI